MPRSVRIDTKQPTGDQITVSFDEAIERIKKKAQNYDCQFTFGNVNDPRFEFILFYIFKNRYILVTDIPENVNNVLEDFLLVWNDQIAKQATKQVKKDTVGNHFVASDTISFLTELFNRLRSVYGTFPNQDDHSAEECQKCEATDYPNRKAPNVSVRESEQLIAEFRDLLETVFMITENRDQPFSFGTLTRLSSLLVKIEVKIKAISETMKAEGAGPLMISKCVEATLKEAYDHFQKESQEQKENKEPEVDPARANYNPAKGKAELLALLSQAKAVRQRMDIGMGVADLTFRFEGELLFQWNGLSSDGQFFLEDNRAYWENEFKRINLRIVSMPDAQEQSSN